MLSVTSTYHPATQTFERIISLGLTDYGLSNQVFREAWKLTPDGPYTAVMTSPKRLTEQFSEAFPGVPMDEWESLADSIDDAQDIVSMEEAWTAFLDICYEYGLAD